ncbi:dipeptide/oligopeptide/nickel ABC transporter ATP-binding protein [Pseudomonas ogarae]|uniref:ABC transporter ATP-binding protein n=1 Tax=Pseudomonas ogarae (strain DSM 112162 / CECT 30235 / F113) TaxID=1114970 RepID=UPI0009A26CA5|nr:ABC transporter ATP-binding protein [Pseudomonas ogarae]OPG72155.1 dipeptide/oligopeptide/nickel ABC transporter ATP-binding protein [Pseudomonas ogarae]
MSPLAINVRGLEISIPTLDGRISVVRGVDCQVVRGETLAIVGESGCGKSLTALALAGLLPEGVHVTEGAMELLGEDVSSLSENAWSALRGRRIAMIFQDPMTALNPVHSIGKQIVEAILAHRPLGARRAREEALGLLSKVRLPRPLHTFAAYPHQLSGGMRQRVLIAMAIANQPDVLVADEPTTALDATVQAEILELLRELRSVSGMALVIITHDLDLVARWADRVTVMYAGRAVESGSAAALLADPQHPYTRALLAARPHRRSGSGVRQRLAEIPGRVPPPAEIGPGCAFAGRCELKSAACTAISPEPLARQHGVVWCHAVTSAAHNEEVCL